MKAMGKRVRGGVAALLSAFLIVSGAAIIAPAANAEEGSQPDTSALVETVAPTAEESGVDQPGEDSPAEEPATEQSGEEAPADEPSDEGGDDATNSAQSPIKQARGLAGGEDASEPKVVVVGDVTDLVPGAENTVTVRGSGFYPAAPATTGARPPLAGQFTGVYVAFGSYAQVWEPSKGAASATRSNVVAKWALPVSAHATVGGAAAGAIELSDDGTFETTLNLTRDQSKALAGGSWGIVTYPGGGATYAPFETFTDVTFEGEYNPRLRVYLEDGVTEYNNQPLKAGDKLVVKGIGYDPAANVPGTAGGQPISNSLPQGTFVVFGNFDAKWKPSNGVGADKRVMNAANRGWALDPDVLDQVPPPFHDAIRNGGYVPLNADGSFTWNVTLTEPAVPLKDGIWGIYSYAGGASGITNAAQELAVPLNFTAVNQPAEDDDEELATGGLQWSFVDSWASYVTNAAGGTITASDGATKGAGNVITYEQASHNYSADTNRGNIIYRGTVVYGSTAHGFKIAMRDPWVTFTADGVTMTAEVSTTETSGTSKMERVIVASLTPPTSTTARDGSLVWTNVATTIASTIKPATWATDYGTKAGASVTFSLGANSSEDDDKETGGSGGTTPPSTPRAAGWLNWGISSAFADYTLGNIAKGEITTSGVGFDGGAYRFPQATGSDWNFKTNTGTVRFSGVVTFTGHNGLMTERFANPVITRTSSNSGTISSSGRTYGLNFTNAGFTANANGTVTFSNVGVNGVLSGGAGAGAGGSLAMDNLNFTVGVVSNVSYGSTVTTAPSAQQRTPAETPPATTGLTVVTDSSELVQGGEVEITAGGFEPNEEGILVVIYSEPTVLDTNAKADANGVVRWIGTLPEGLTGTHTLTLQGSQNLGMVIEIAESLEEAELVALAADGGATVAGTAPIADSSSPAWIWWVSALALLAVAAASTALVVAQRRKGEIGAQL